MSFEVIKKKIYLPAKHFIKYSKSETSFIRPQKSSQCLVSNIKGCGKPTSEKTYISFIRFCYQRHQNHRRTIDLLGEQTWGRR